MVPFSQGLWLAAVGVLFSFVAFSANAQDEKLVPATSNQVMDKRGNRWDFNSYGSVSDGTNDCFDNGAVLQTNGSQVSFPRAMMTADGSEFVYSTRNRGLTITRRIRLDSEVGAVRYLEIFENPSNSPQRLVATIHTDLGNGAQRIVSAEDKMLVGGLGKDDSAFVAVQTDGSRPSVIFVVTDPKSKSKPEVRVQGNRSFDIVFTAEVPANGSVAFVHYMAQRLNGSANDARELLGTYFKRGRLIDQKIPKNYHKAIANFAFRAAGDDAEEGKLPPLLAPLAEISESAGLPRGKIDGLAIDLESKLVGVITGNDFEIETAWGKTPVAFADIAGIAGGAGVQRPVRVFLRNGEILTGAVHGAKFAMKTDSGLSLDVDLAEIHLLTLRSAEGDGVAPQKATMLITTQRGDRLALSDESTEPFEVASPWGTARVALAELRSLTSAREPFPSHRLVLADRSQLSVMMRGGEWSAPTLRFGAIKIVPQNIRDLQRVASSPPESADAKIAGPRCEIVGEARLAGVIDLPTVNLTAESSVTPVDPKQIVQIESEVNDRTGRIFTIKLVGGQELKGGLAETFLPIRNGSRVWRVPAAQFVAFRVPEPPEEEKPAETKPAETKSPEAPKGEPTPKPPVRI